MNEYTSVSNILIGFLILILIVLSLIILKYSYRKVNLPKSTSPSQKITKQQLQKLSDQNIISQILSQNRFKYLLKSYLIKYSLIGTLFNKDKKYLLKQFMVISIYVGCVLGINKITLWPIPVGFSVIICSYILYQLIFRAQWSCLIYSQQNQQINRIKCGREIQGIVAPQDFIIENSQQQLTKANKNKDNNFESINVGKQSLDPRIQRSQNMKDNKKVINLVLKKQQLKNTTKPTAQIIILSLISVLTILLFFHAMFTIFNSLSNLGILNLQSWLLMSAIDQFGVRVVSFLLISIASYILHYTFLPMHQNKIIVALCYEELYEQIHRIRQQRIKQIEETSVQTIRKNNQQNDNNLIKKNIQQIDSQFNLFQKTYRSKKQEDQQQEEDQLSQIEEIDIITRNNQDKTQQQQQNGHNNVVKPLKDIYSHSAQRPIKQPQSVLKQHNYHDDLILVDNALNYINQLNSNNYQDQNMTIDINFSPTKQTKKRLRTRKNKRVMIITGSSPYLEYLPDMMKKVERNLSKGIIRQQKKIL